MNVNQIQNSCDMQQGFNFRKDVQAQIGFLTKLRIGTIDFSPDITLKDPENNQSDLKAVGVASHLGWSVSATDPVRLVLQVSEKAKNQIDTLTKKDMSNVEVDMSFDCYNYDPSEKKYFKNFHTNDTEVHGLLMGKGPDLDIQIQTEASPIVQEPRNYTLVLGIKPQSKAQELHYASSVSDKLVMQWGIDETS